MGEPSGSVIDTMGGLSGTVNGTTTRDITGAINALNDDGAITFGGTGSVQVPDQGKLDYGTGPFSVELWFRRRSESGMGGGAYNTLWSKAGQFNGYIESDQILVDNDGSEVVRSSVTVTDTNWHHLVYTKDEANVSGSHHLWLDGVDVVSVVSGTAGYASNTTDLFIGAYYAGGLDGNFDMDELSFYPFVLTSTQVGVHYSFAASPAAAGSDSYPYVGGGYYPSAA